jgi:hypothetical protein
VGEKIQDWQSDGYIVLGPQGCTVGGFHGKEHNNQCSVILCNPGLLQAAIKYPSCLSYINATLIFLNRFSKNTEI